MASAPLSYMAAAPAPAAAPAAAGNQARQQQPYPALHHIFDSLAPAPPATATGGERAAQLHPLAALPMYNDDIMMESFEGAGVGDDMEEMLGVDDFLETFQGELELLAVGSSTGGIDEGDADAAPLVPAHV